MVATTINNMQHKKIRPVFTMIFEAINVEANNVHNI